MPLSSPAALADKRAALEQVDAAEAAAAAAWVLRMRSRAAMLSAWLPDGDSPAARLRGSSWDDLVLELAGTAGIGQVRAATQLGDALRLSTVLQATLAAVASGAVALPCAEQLVTMLRSRSDRVAGAVQDAVLPRLAVGTTTDQRRVIAEAVVQAEAELEPELALEREEAARGRRDVWISPDDDGLCQVSALLDTLDGKRWSLEFDDLVRAQRVADTRDGVVRTAAQRRAAVFAALPVQLTTLLRAIASGRVAELQGLVTDGRLSLDTADDLEDLATLTRDLHTQTDDPADDAASDAEGTDTADLDADSPVEISTEAETAQPGGVRQDVPLTATDLPVEGTPPSSPAWFDVAVRLCSLRLADPRVLNVHVPMATLLDVDERGGWVDGLGPLGSWRVRALAPTVPFRRVVVDQRTGQPLAWEPQLYPPSRDDLGIPGRPPSRPRPPGPGTPVGTSHQPHTSKARTPAERTAAQLQQQLAGVRTCPPPTDTAKETGPDQDRAERLRDRVLTLTTPTVVTDTSVAPHDPTRRQLDLLALRDQTCRGIGCSCGSARSEADHETRWPDGPTATWNLGLKSPRCHHAKHRDWLVHRDETTGITTWTSPAGRTYVVPGPWAAPARLPDSWPAPQPARKAAALRPRRTQEDLTDQPLTRAEPVVPPRTDEQPDDGAAQWDATPPPF